MNQYGVDIEGLSKKLLVISLFMNIIFIIAYIAVVLYIESKGGPRISNQGFLVENLKYIFPLVSVIDMLVAVYLKKRDFFRPMIKSRETFAKDFDSTASVASIRLFAIAETIAVFGLILYFTEGNLQQFFIYLAISLLFFLYIRPTKGFLLRSLAHQEALVSRGEFAKRESE